MNNVKTPCVFPSSLRNKTSQTSWSPPSCPTPRGGRCALVLATPKHGLVLGHKDLTLNRHSLLPVFKLYKWSRRHMFFYNFFFYHCICNTLPCWHVSSAWIPFYKHPKLCVLFKDLQTVPNTPPTLPTMLLWTLLHIMPGPVSQNSLGCVPVVNTAAGLQGANALSSAGGCTLLSDSCSHQMFSKTLPLLYVLTCHHKTS